MKNLSRQYLENRIMTAPQEELLLLLIEGAIRFVDEAKVRQAESKFEESSGLFIRAQRIMVELISSLDAAKLDPQIYANLCRLYWFVYWRLVQAGMQRDARMADEGLLMLRKLQGMWLEAVDRYRKDRPVAEPAKVGGEARTSLDVRT